MKRLVSALLIFTGAPLLGGCPKSGDAAQAQHADGDAYAQAEAAKAAGKTDEAMAACRTALARDPSRLDAWRLLVQLYAEGARLSEIRGELEQKVSASPNDDALHYALGLAYFAETRTAGDKALQEFAKAEQLKPNVAEYPFRLGVAYFELERYTDALPPLQKAVQLAPNQAKYHVPLGLSLAKLGRKQEALAQFRTLLELQPTGRDVKLAQQALERLDDPLRDIPKAEADNVQRGIEWLHQADQPQQAIDSFQDVLDRYPDLAPVHTLLGLAYERLDDAGPAVEHFQRAIELRPDNALPYLYLGELYTAKQKPERAVDYYQKALERNPLLQQAYARLGEAALSRSDAPAALSNFKALVTLAPEDPKAHKSLAGAYELAGQYDKAEAELAGVASRDPKDLDVLLRIGFLNAELGKRAATGSERQKHYDAAQAAFQKVLDAQPENVAASRALQELRASPGAK